MQMLAQRGVIAGGILIEQPAQIGFTHCRRCRAGAEPGKLQPRAVIIVRVGVACRFERGHRTVTIAELIADGAERKPGGGKTRCDRDGLRQQVGCSNKVAPPGEFDGCLVTAIADKVAGRYKQWAGIGHETLAPQSIVIIYHS